MTVARIALFCACAALLSVNALGQDTKTKKAPVDDDATTTKYRGQLPFYWKELGLTDEQRQKVYKIHNDYNDQIEGLEQKIKELKAKRDKERLEVLSVEQKKRLEAIIRSKIGG
jgi:Spy/CpxP family protein refolding chaperone